MSGQQLAQEVALILADRAIPWHSGPGLEKALDWGLGVGWGEAQWVLVTLPSPLLGNHLLGLLSWCRLQGKT